MPDQPAADCPFCGRVDRGEYEPTPDREVVRFAPLNPVTPGHMLFVPRHHVEHRTSRDEVARAMGQAAYWGQHQGDGTPWSDPAPFNLITSCGAAATQTVPHVHVHYVPRRPGDHLPLPWTNQSDRAHLADDLLGLHRLVDAWQDRARDAERERDAARDLLAASESRAAALASVSIDAVTVARALLRDMDVVAAEVPAARILRAAGETP